MRSHLSEVPLRLPSGIEFSVHDWERFAEVVPEAEKEVEKGVCGNGDRDRGSDSALSELDGESGQMDNKGRVRGRGTKSNRGEIGEREGGLRGEQEGEGEGEGEDDDNEFPLLGRNLDKLRPDTPFPPPDYITQIHDPSENPVCVCVGSPDRGKEGEKEGEMGRKKEIGIEKGTRIRREKGRGREQTASLTKPTGSTQTHSLFTFY